MFRSFGIQELIIVLVIVLVLFGPKQLPKLSRMFGKAMKDVKDGLEGKGEDPEELPPGKSEADAADEAKKSEDKKSEEKTPV
jgi:sec-independent protein translocase protein TatA